MAVLQAIIVFCILFISTYTEDIQSFGPFCWSNTCYTGDVENVCNELDGLNVGDTFCLLDADKYSLLGPFCWNDTCYEAQSACNDINGYTLGDGIWCITDNVKLASLGPFCYYLTDSDDNWSCIEANNICTEINGIEVGNGWWCIADSTKYQFELA